MSNKPKYILVHCTDVSQKVFDQFKSVNDYHASQDFPLSSLGYFVGYHALITGGKLRMTKEDWEEGAHCNNTVGGLSMNFQSLAVCLGFDGDIEMPEQYMIPLMVGQIQEWQKKFGIPEENVMFHRDFRKDKTCPGSLITREWLLKQLANAKEEGQKAKMNDIVAQMNAMQLLLDGLKRLLFERFGIK